MEACGESLLQWSKDNNNKSIKEIESISRKINIVRQHVGGENINYFTALKRRLNTLLVKDDIFWKQRAKVHWYKDGDLNTRFFHISASTRKKVNTIRSLTNDNGEIVSSSEGMCKVAHDYFIDLFQKKPSSRDWVLQAICTTISNEDNDMLTNQFDIAEFKEAFFSMQADKSPSPDGFNPGFYHQFWDLCGDEIFNASCSWLESGIFPEKLNSTNITLIPKGDSQSTMKDWRPIALCNVLYKVIAKVLANRLKRVLDKCISDNQSTFVPGRSILDNAMAAIEVVHHMKAKTRGKAGDIALKLDISKAYDRIDWDYLKDVLSTMGFCQKWIGWIILCVETVDYSVGVNGKLVGPIVLGRGLRQGDSLSPYLFILCSEGLSALIKQAEAQGDIHAAISEANMMKSILTTYEEASGQAINFQISEFYCSRNIDPVLKNLMADTLGVQQVLGTGKYLGVPSMIGRNRKATFKFIKDRIWKKINSWSSRSLSQAGRETLIKSVLQSIPTYIMSIFLLPSSSIDEIEKMLNSFWWGHKRGSAKGIHWLSWDRLSMPKNVGGMGFKNLSAFNYAMLSKQAWSLMKNPNTLVSRLYKARYFPSCNFLKSEIGHNPCYVWRSIWSAKFVVRGGYKWSIGTGERISVWDQNWLHDCSTVTNPWPDNPMVVNLKVSDLLSPTGKQWNLNLIHQLVGGGVAQKIVNTPLFEAVHEDRIVWNLENNDIFSVRSAYRYCINEAIDTSHLRINENWDLIWKMKIPPRVKNFLWCLCRNCVPTRVRLIDKGVGCLDSCVICGSGFENNNHLYFQCPKSIVCWEKVGLWHTIQQLVSNGGDFVSFVFSFLQASNHENKAVLSTIMWSIWKSRNNALWNQIEESPDNICMRCSHLLLRWRDAHQVRNIVSPVEQLTAVTKWCKPPYGRFKCNIDASFSSNKALSLLAAIKWVLELGYDNMDFESDSKTVVDSVTIPKPSDSNFGAITRVCYQLLTHSTKNFQVKFIRRQANEVAHALAKAAPFHASSHTFNDKTATSERRTSSKRWDEQPQPQNGPEQAHNLNETDARDGQVASSFTHTSERRRVHYEDDQEQADIPEEADSTTVLLLKELQKINRLIRLQGDRIDELERKRRYRSPPRRHYRSCSYSSSRSPPRRYRRRSPSSSRSPPKRYHRQRSYSCSPPRKSRRNQRPEIAEAGELSPERDSRGPSKVVLKPRERSPPRDNRKTRAEHR
ncbi:uncharacterized protein LOC131630038 [Vicia villosa]|uniref:uncharacterized protein LOC131630038 n=1 Tax=Vicia villosa TaxID=3911 RepID=UPI00273C2AE3|nr:uncharacterized protein LOC131630038 [Vicia villosa]